MYYTSFQKCSSSQEENYRLIFLIPALTEILKKSAKQETVFILFFTICFWYLVKIVLQATKTKMQHLVQKMKNMIMLSETRRFLYAFYDGLIEV